MRIIGPATGTYSAVLDYCQPLTNFDFRTYVIDALWEEAERYGIDPVGVVAQSIKETGGGTFGGRVKSGFYNTAGIKIRHQAMFPGITTGDEPLAHQTFANWQVGARAHVQHLRAYTGWPVPADDLIVDPRYTYVIGMHWCEDWSELGGKWAPSPTYGTEIQAIMLRLVGGAGS